MKQALEIFALLLWLAGATIIGGMDGFGVGLIIIAIIIFAKKIVGWLEDSL